MTTHLKARPTTYKGIKMRSRLEALFAASLEGLCSWEYEPECFADETGQYLPDFRCDYTSNGMNTVYVEIKPTWDAVEQASRKMAPIHSTHPAANLSIYIPHGAWPDITFHMAASKVSATSPWRFIPPPSTPAPAPRGTTEPRPADLVRVGLRGPSQQRRDEFMCEWLFRNLDDPEAVEVVKAIARASKFEKSVVDIVNATPQLLARRFNRGRGPDVFVWERMRHHVMAEIRMHDNAAMFRAELSVKYGRTVADSYMERLGVHFRDDDSTPPAPSDANRPT